ncbi:MAG: LysM peptidoglycan-binding domain-containing protein [Chloroflexi bacterium]|nr:LysM peptidoglycan-binding domain-containing protein [Chloroflexota bacterium]
MNWRRLFVYLILNAIVSAAVTLTVLAVWDATHRAPVALPSATPIPQPPLSITRTAQAVLPSATATPTVYEVKGGDTLGSIALQFDVSVDAIMKANGLDDPNTLSVGQKLVIPVAGFIQPTTTPQSLTNPNATPVTPPPTGTAVEAGSAPQLAIRSITDAGNLATEKITIVNLGGVVDLSGWTLRDDQGNMYAFPALSLFQGGAVSVHTGLGRDTVTDLYWGQGGAMWQSGETATLIDPKGRAHTTFTTP